MKNTIVLQSKEICYTLEYSRRRTIGIMISAEKGIVVRVPLNISKCQLEDVLLKKSDWILKKWEEISEKKARVPDRYYKDGEKWYYLGCPYRLKIYINDNGNTDIGIKDESLNIMLPMYLLQNREMQQEVIRGLLSNWYKQMAYEYILNTAPKFEQQIGQSAKKYMVKNQKSCYGTCSADGVIRIKYHLIMAPSEILDYVIVHELCHLIHKNHQKQFWELVETILPNYKECRNWLKDYGLCLKI